HAIALVAAVALANTRAGASAYCTLHGMCQLLPERGCASCSPRALNVYERLGGPETPEKLAETEQFATVERDRVLHQTGAPARRPESGPVGDRRLCLLDRSQSGLDVAGVYKHPRRPFSTTRNGPPI